MAHQWHMRYSRKQPHRPLPPAADVAVTPTSVQVAQHRVARGGFNEPFIGTGSTTRTRVPLLSLDRDRQPPHSRYASVPAPLDLLNGSVRRQPLPNTGLFPVGVPTSQQVRSPFPHPVLVGRVTRSPVPIRGPVLTPDARPPTGIRLVRSAIPYSTLNGSVRRAPIFWDTGAPPDSYFRRRADEEVQPRRRVDSDASASLRRADETVTPRRRSDSDSDTPRRRPSEADGLRRRTDERIT